jgi:hypothetical protein
MHGDEEAKQLLDRKFPSLSRVTIAFRVSTTIATTATTAHTMPMRCAWLAVL